MGALAQLDRAGGSHNLSVGGSSPALPKVIVTKCSVSYLLKNF